MNQAMKVEGPLHVVCQCDKCKAESQAIAELESQEPVAKAWAEGYRMGIADERTSEANIGIAGFNAKVEPDRQNPYGTPQPKQEQDEPFGWYDMEHGEIRDVEWHRQKPTYEGVWRPLYTHPPQRTWVGLTIAEITDEFYKFETASAWYQFAQAIEAKLKEKNI